MIPTYFIRASGSDNFRVSFCDWNQDFTGDYLRKPLVKKRVIGQWPMATKIHCKIDNEGLYLGTYYLQKIMTITTIKPILHDCIYSLSNFKSFKLNRFQVILPTRYLQASLAPLSQSLTINQTVE